MFLCLADSKPKQLPSMDDVLSQILDACKLARELENYTLRLSNFPTDTSYLLASCEEVTAAFNRAIRQLLHSQTLSPYTPGQLLFGAQAAEGSSRGAGYMQAIDLLRAPAADVDNNPFYPRAGPSVNEMALPELPQLALEIQSTTAAMGVGEFGGCSSYVTRPPSPDADAFVGAGGRGEAPATSSGRKADRSLAQRPSRKRSKEGTVTRRVPALRTAGNVELHPDDGYTWRKYGQKDILNSRFPRSYYRCTHKSYYGCEAKKQVQRLDEDPYTFEVTYCGTHTCQTSPTPILIPAFVTPGNTRNEDDSGGNPPPQGGAPPPPPLTLETAMQPAATSQPPAAAAATPMQLRNWLEVDRRSIGSLLYPHSTTGASASGGQMQGGRDIVEGGSVAELADAMFNSGGSSSSSMDVIFSPRNGK